MRTRIPCIMYHSVGIIDKDWHWNYLTCPVEKFESQLKWFEKTGYHTLNFQEVYDHIINDHKIPEKSVFLTFDDGYLDNYLFAYPLLKKYGMKGTIFANPDFIQEGKPRQIPEKEEWKKISINKTKGFCNWEELRIIDSSGVLDVQSHAKTHTWYPISDKIIDFRNPADEYIWMDWNNYPDQKPYLQNLDMNLRFLGEAVFENEKSMLSPRVFINPEFQKSLVDYVTEHGGRDFFNKAQWKTELNSFAHKLAIDKNVITEHETNDAFFKRIEYELGYTKDILEEKLKKKINFLCWPGGSATKIGIRIADKLGYLMSTAALDLTKEERKAIQNSSNYKINRISRFTPVCYKRKMKNRNKDQIFYSPGWFLIFQCWQFEKKYFAHYWMKLFFYLSNKIN